MHDRCVGTHLSYVSVEVLVMKGLQGREYMMMAMVMMVSIRNERTFFSLKIGSILSQ